MALGEAFAADAAPKMQFPSAARERIAIASYPFREFIAGHEAKAGDDKRMELKEFAAHVSAKFNIKKIEPWSEHFRSLDKGYLDELRAAVAKSNGMIVNIAVDGEHSPYAADAAERERVVAFSKQWIDAAVAIGSPSVRTNIPPAKDSKPDVERTAESLKRVAEYGAAKNVVVNLENDNAVSEDPFFLVKVIEKVNSEWLHALPDFANTLAAYEEEYAYRGIDAMFGYAYNISHVKETEVGDGKDKIAHVDLPRTFGIAKRHGYKGYFSMEWDSPGDPYAGTAGLMEKTLKNLASDLGKRQADPTGKRSGRGCGFWRARQGRTR
ncbi:MAG TPA: sugar phosphate isomerase/epimerase family protein [Candidatus Acidoferrum sp.]|nr:sugar phosphate isomerase/epimerase family protein [Candidatus Acidoferrum sp.]